MYFFGFFFISTNDVKFSGISKLKGTVMFKTSSLKLFSHFFIVQNFHTCILIKLITLSLLPNLSTTHTISSQLYVVLLKNSLSPLGVHGCRTIYWSMITFQGPHLWRKLIFLPPAAVICQYNAIPPWSMLGLWPALLCVGLVHAMTTVKSSCMQE